VRNGCWLEFTLQGESFRMNPDFIRTGMIEVIMIDRSG